MIHFSYTWWFTNDMSTTHCGTNIVRIRVDLLNDILRFDYALRIFFFLLLSFYCELSAVIVVIPHFVWSIENSTSIRILIQLIYLICKKIEFNSNLNSIDKNLNSILNSVDKFDSNLNSIDIFLIYSKSI